MKLILLQYGSNSQEITMSSLIYGSGSGMGGGMKGGMPDGKGKPGNMPDNLGDMKFKEKCLKTFQI